MGFDQGGVGLTSGTDMKIKFTEEDPSGMYIPDSYDLPIVFKHIALLPTSR
jgi:hypothetical protein